MDGLGSVIEAEMPKKNMREMENKQVIIFCCS